MKHRMPSNCQMNIKFYNIFLSFACDLNKAYITMELGLDMPNHKLLLVKLLEAFNGEEKEGRQRR